MDSIDNRLQKMYRMLMSTLLASLGAFIVDNILLTFRLVHIVQAVGRYCK